MRSGDVAIVFQKLADEYDANIEPLTTINGYRTPAYNLTVGGYPGSNHTSATALDFNGAKHPYERSLPTSLQGAHYPSGFTAAQVAKVRVLLAAFDGVIRWGYDFASPFRDAMHFEIHGTAAQVAAVARKIKAQEDDVTPDDIAAIAAAVWRTPVQRGGKAVPAIQELADTKTGVLALLAQGDGVDEKALAAALAPMLTGPLVTALEAAHVPSAQEVADAVVADLGAAITKGAAG